MNSVDIIMAVITYVLLTSLVVLAASEETEYSDNQKGILVAIALWPITLILMSPVLLVKTGAVIFKRRGLLGSWLSVITDTYKGAVK